MALGVYLVANLCSSSRWGVGLSIVAAANFSPPAAALSPNHLAVRDVEKALRAQIQRALRSGVKVDYVDYHMGTVTRYPEFRDVAERLAREYGLGMSEYFGETMNDPQ